MIYPGPSGEVRRCNGNRPGMGGVRIMVNTFVLWLQVVGIWIYYLLLIIYNWRGGEDW